MTVITLARDARTTRYVLVADSVVNPFGAGTAVLHRAKVLQIADGVIGLAGDPHLFDHRWTDLTVEAMLAQTMPAGDYSLIMLGGRHNFAYIFHGAPTHHHLWYSPIRLGQQAAIGCFKDMLSSCLDLEPHVVPTAQQAVDAIHRLHSAYGFDVPIDLHTSYAVDRALPQLKPSTIRKEV